MKNPRPPAINLLATALVRDLLSVVGLYAFVALPMVLGLFGRCIGGCC